LETLTMHQFSFGEVLGIQYSQCALISQKRLSAGLSIVDRKGAKKAVFWGPKNGLPSPGIFGMLDNS